LAQGGLPIPNRHRPFFGYVGKGKAKYLQYRRIVGKRPLVLITLRSERLSDTELDHSADASCTFLSPASQSFRSRRNLLAKLACFV